MVATSQPLASAAGVEVLRAGGTAADAAVAAAAVLAVVEPCSTGIGGDAFALCYDAGAGRVTALNGSGRSAAALTLERLGAEGLAPLPPFHAHTVTVPGACAAWADAVARHGALPLARVLEPAIRVASEGFPVQPVAAHFWERGAERLRAAAGGVEMLVDGGRRAPRAGEVYRNPGLAGTLRAIALEGPDAFYRGPIAARIAEAVRRAGGALTTADLAGHRSTWQEPLSVRYRGARVWECPPNSQGIVAIRALERLGGGGPLPPPDSLERLEALLAAIGAGFAHARDHVGDPAPAEADTVYLCAVDGRGNACSFINSNYMGFGTGIVPAGLGFTLQNRGAGFGTEPGHANALAPRKRPYHTLMPGLLTREADGSLLGPFGVMGGFMQPQGHVQVAVALLDDGLDPQAALDRPRFCLDVAGGTGGDRVFLEEGFPDDLARALAARGREVVPGVAGHERAVFGRGQLILRAPDGALAGGSDRRADGCALAVVATRA